MTLVFFFFVSHFMNASNNMIVKDVSYKKKKSC